MVFLSVPEGSELFSASFMRSLIVTPFSAAMRFSSSFSHFWQMNVSLSDATMIIILAMSYDNDYYNTMIIQKAYKFSFTPTKCSAGRALNIINSNKRSSGRGSAGTDC